MSQIFKHLIKEYSGQSQLSIVHLPQTSIFQQLLLEESIYRISPNTSNAWLFFNNYTELLPDTCQLVSPGRTVRESQSGNSIVLGISGIPDHVVIKSSVENDNVELIRRYTGGGTVIISPAVFIVSMILPRSFFGTRAFPKDIISWSGKIYQKVFPPWNGREFKCRENDYTIESDDGLQQKKVGGNAQAFGRRFVAHHTSFLWNVDYSSMNRYLKLPKRQPHYRDHRSHEDFAIGLNCDQFGFGGLFDNSNEAIDRISFQIEKEFESKGFKIRTLLWNNICDEIESLVEEYSNKNSNLRSTWRIDLDGKRILTPTGTC